MAKIVARKIIEPNTGTLGVVGSMTFCVLEPGAGILVVPSDFDSPDGNGWG